MRLIFVSKIIGLHLRLAAAAIHNHSTLIPMEIQIGNFHFQASSRKALLTRTDSCKDITMLAKIPDHRQVVRNEEACPFAHLVHIQPASIGVFRWYLHR